MNFPKKHWIISLLIFIILLFALFILGEISLKTTLTDVTQYIPPPQTQTAAVSDFNSNLVAHYTFDDTTNDSAGSNHGTAVGGPTYVEGKIGKAMSFDGSDDYISLPNEGNFDFDRTQPFTVAAWINYTPGGASYNIFTKQQTYGKTPGIEFLIDATNSRLRLYLIDNLGGTISSGGSNNSLSPGTWHHIVATYDGSSSGAGVKVYKNGSQQFTGSGTIAASILNDSAVKIGVTSAQNFGFFKGMMDDLRIYNRALSAAEIGELYNPVQAADPPADPPVDPPASTIDDPCDPAKPSPSCPTTVEKPPVEGEHTITAASCSQEHVQQALNLATAGDIVRIPAGTCQWTTSVSRTLPPNVTLMGAGTSAMGGGDLTIIKDNIAASSPLLRLNVPSSGVFRMTGITFQSGTGTIKDGGTVSIYGPGTVRLDHLHFIMTSKSNYKSLLIGPGVFGVLDHSILDFKGSSAIYLYNGRQGSGDIAGNLEWSLPTDFGGPYYFFIEDNIVNGSSDWTAYDTRLFDGFSGAKVVARFNTLVAATIGETHATGHASDDRGLRSQEVYGNMVTSPLAKDPNFTLVDIGSGTALVWGNTADRVYKNMLLFKVTRTNNNTYSQRATPNGWGYAGKAFNGTGSMWDGGTVLGTDLMTGYPALDQPGRGQGDLLTGLFPSKVNSTTGTISWPRQALEPVYIWRNVGSIVSGWGGAYYSNLSGGRVAANRDYYPQASGIQTSPTNPFDGTSGTGWGTLAYRPVTCTKGVGYWATDQGSWNTSLSNTYGVEQRGADGVLYTCTSTNTWTLYYTPYVYPHPLVTGTPPPPVTPPTLPPSSPPTPPAPSTLTADFNSDGRVNSLDFSALSTNWNQNSPTHDLNKDGIVNTLDYSILIQQWTG